MMVALLLYAYARGERSARRIERSCVEDVAYRVIAANRKPDHATIARTLLISGRISLVLFVEDKIKHTDVPEGVQLSEPPQQHSEAHARPGRGRLLGRERRRAVEVHFL